MFEKYDFVIDHLAELIKSQSDDYIKSRYVGFVAVSAITIYEVNVKTLLVDFACREHIVLGNYISNEFGKLNAKIKRDDLEKYLSNFDKRYENRFKEIVEKKENAYEVKQAYANLIQWRHDFVHAGVFHNNATFEEAVKSYHLGKNIIIALKETLDVSSSQLPNS